MSLSWKSSLAGNEYRIFRGKLIAGILKISFWKGDAYGELNGHMLRFKPKGFWRNGTQILDIEGARALGTITYNHWNSTAEIIYEGTSYLFRYKSWWKQQWHVTNNEAVVDYKRTGFWKSEGTIENEELSPALVLAGLFVHCHFARLAAAAA